MSRAARSAVDSRVYPSIAVGDPGEMARALVRHAGASGYGKRLFVIEGRGRAPRARREIATWWIAPARGGLIYWSGKIIVTSRYGGGAVSGGVAKSLFAGLCMQKGLDSWASQPPAADRTVNAPVETGHPRWVWEDFLPEMAAGYFDPLAAMAEDFGGCPLTVILDARDPGADGAETIAFEWSRGQMAPLPSPHRRARGHLRDFASASTLTTLARRLRYAPQCRGLWIELAIGFQLWVNRTGPGSVAWDECRIWESACRPWSLWLR
jgi:hypothetical protein